MNGLVDQPAFVGLELEGYNTSVSLISFRVDQAVTAPYKFSSKYEPTKRNFSAIEPMKEMYFLTSELRYVSFVNDALVTACGLKPPKGYLVKYDPKAKKVPVSFPSYQAAIDYSSSGGKVCVWYEFVKPSFAKGAAKRLRSFIESVDQERAAAATLATGARSTDAESDFDESE